MVAPTEHLKTQWALAAARVGHLARPRLQERDGRAPAPTSTASRVTYAGVAAHPALHRARTERRRTLVILDEVHHGGDALTWGDAVREAFEPATRRLCLTGTPFRSDTNPIPFVRYERGPDGITRSAVRLTPTATPTRCATASSGRCCSWPTAGTATWRTRAGEEITATLGEPLTVEQTAAAWRTALDPHGDWMPAVLQAADRRLTQKRQGGMPDAGGMVIATRPEDRPAVRRAAARHHRPGAGRRAVRRPDGLEEDRRSSRPRTTAGWSRCGWCRRASTSRAWPSGSTPPAPRRRCSSPRRSAGSCGPARRGRPRRCSCRRCRRCWPWPAEMEAERDHALDGAGEGAVPRRRAAGRGQPASRTRTPTDEAGVHRAAGLGAPRPGDLRRRRVRHRRRARLGGRGGLPRPARPAAARPGARAAGGSGSPRSSGRAGAAAGRAGGAPAGRRRSRCCRRCARSSTGWSARGTTGPASRTA